MIADAHPAPVFAGAPGVVYRSRVISSVLSRTSAGLLLLGGVGLLFASDALLPRLAPGVPAAAAWLGQLLGAAWLGVASLNWLQRAARLGGIYGRPIVLANLVLYFVSALSLLRARLDGVAPPAAWPALAVAAAMAAAYAALLLRGPFDTPRPRAADAA
jgi:hypothetical protein